MDEKYRYLNLQQQVGKNKKEIEELWSTKFALERAGVRVVGEETSASNLPNPITYPGEYGDAYLVGAEPPFDMYVFTQPSVGETNNKWLNLGQFPAQGPQGTQGPEGPQGPQGDASNWRFGTVNPSILDTDRIHDGYLNTTTGMVYEFDGERWIAIGSIRGPQGVQGPKGETGPKGEMGIKGDTGERGPSGIVIEVIGVVANTGSLPDPSTVARNAGYIVDDGVDKDLYIIVEDESQILSWYNAGPFTGTPGQAAVISNAQAILHRISPTANPEIYVQLSGSSTNRGFAFHFWLPLGNFDIENDDNDPISDVNGWTQEVIKKRTLDRVITGLYQLGLTAPVKMQQIISTLISDSIPRVKNSMVLLYNYNNYDQISDAPTAKGQLVIIQNDPYRNFDIRWIDDSYNVYIYNGSVGTPEVAQWNRLLTSKDAAGIGTPVGGTTGQILAKKSDEDFDTEWKDVPNAPNGTPEGGSTGQILAKKSGTDYDDEWITPPTGIPDGGSTGQMLVKQSNADGDAAWQTPPVGLLSAGTTGQVLKKSSGENFDVEWSTPHEVPAGGTTGQVLTKSSNSDYETSWQTPAAGGGGGYSPNILLNSDFSINQRGGSPWSSTSSTAKYTVDRWYMKAYGGGTVSVTKPSSYGSIILESLESSTEINFGQIIDAPYLLGQKVTLSCKVNNVSGYITANIPSSAPAASTKVGEGVINGLVSEIWYDNDSRVSVIFRAGYLGGSITISCPKLEIGETPTPYVAPDPATEMEKCRYYFRQSESIYLRSVFYIESPYTGIQMQFQGKSTAMRVSTPTIGSKSAGVTLKNISTTASRTFNSQTGFTPSVSNGVYSVYITYPATDVNTGYGSVIVKLDAEIYPS